MSSEIYLPLPFWHSHTQKTGFVDINPSIKQAGGKVVALSSQTREQVEDVARDWRLPFEVIGDPTNKLIMDMNER